MNVLLRFEDKYGCYSLFKYCNSILNSKFYKAENLNVEVENGLTCNGVFFLDSDLIDNYDFVIIVFDMDNSEDGYGCLTTEILKQRLEKFSCIKNPDINFRKNIKSKLILIPVFFCFETILLFSQELHSYLNSINDSASTQSLKILNLFRKHYDVCRCTPEIFKDILNSSSEHYLNNIRLKVKEITGAASNTWTIQKFYATYFREFLKSKFSKDNESENGFSFSTNKDKHKIIKNTDYVFDTLMNNNCSFNPLDIINSFLKAECQFNVYLQQLYSLQNLEDLKLLIYKNSIKGILQKITKYNLLLYGLQNPPIS